MLLEWLTKLFSDRLETEKEWLHLLRTASEEWYNQLTEPLLPILRPKTDFDPIKQREQYQAIANKLIDQAFVVNAGNAIKNTFKEMGDHGIPFITSRPRLEPLLVNYLESGRFIKCLACGSDLSEARKEWEEFKRCKDTLIDEINNQLSRLG